MTLGTLIARWRAAPRGLFLVDGAGALLSAVTLGVVLPYFATALGTTENALRMLAAAPVLFAAYDLAARATPALHTRTGLRVIAAANGSYPLFSSVVLASDGVPLSGFGLAYFGLEFTVVVALAGLEWHVARGLPR